MSSIYQKTWKDYKSPLRVVAAVLQRSRTNLAERLETLRIKYEESEKLRRKSEPIIQRQGERIRELEEKILAMESSNRRERAKPYGEGSLPHSGDVQCRGRAQQGQS